MKSTEVLNPRRTLQSVADPEISKKGGTDRMLYTPLIAHARAKLHAQCDSAGKRGSTCPLCPMLDPPLAVAVVI